MFQRSLKISSKRSVLIVGSRRCGKTTLLKHRYPEWSYATLDDLDYLDWANRRLSGATTYGQFPEVLIQEKDSDKHEVLVNYRNTYFTRDLMQLSNIENLDGLLAVLQHLTRSMGSHLEVSNFAREAGISHPTTKKYLNALQQAQLTFKLYGYQFGPAKRYIKAAKTYFADNGITHSLNAGVGAGQLLENFVVAEFEKRRKLGMIKADQFYYYKSTGGNEIDLVFEADHTVYAKEPLIFFKNLVD